MTHLSPTIARETARLLLEIEAVHLRPNDPFTYTAGWKSPVYVDCRKVISFPSARRQIIEMMGALLTERQLADAFDLIAGGETAGIPYAAWLSDQMNLPMIYVRKKPKGFGRDAQIEGALKDGDNVLLVEDLATDGGSKVNFVNALRTAGTQCAHSIVVFHHGVFASSGDPLGEAGVSLHTLTNWSAVLDVIEDDQKFVRDELDELRRFLDDPVAWSARHGGLDHMPERQSA